MIEFVNAKINLGLQITGKRPDGYHNLRTVFYPVGLSAGTPQDPAAFSDILEIVPAESDSYNHYGDEIGCNPENNLIIRARNIFNEFMLSEGRKPLSTAIYIKKCLPLQAGMGGGSADASFTLRILNILNGNIYTEETLADLASRLGADCPFFIYNRPLYAEATGNIFSDINVNLKGLWCAIVKPEKGISTREAFEYAGWATPVSNLREIVESPIEKWRGRLYNDFEKAMFTLHPELRKIKEHLYQSGAIYASMTGSGSAFYGIFRNREEALRASAYAGTPYHAVVSL